ncbi:hypothetical protein [Sorangium sp. So ce1182]
MITFLQLQLAFLAVLALSPTPNAGLLNTLRTVERGAVSTMSKEA